MHPSLVRVLPHTFTIFFVDPTVRGEKKEKKKKKKKHVVHVAKAKKEPRRPMSTIFLSRARYVPKRPLIIPIMGATESEVEGYLCSRFETDALLSRAKETRREG